MNETYYTSIPGSDQFENDDDTYGGKLDEEGEIIA